MYNIKSFSKEKQTKGSWHDFYDAQLRVAAISNFAFSDYYNSLRKPYERQLEKGTASTELQTSLLCKALSKHVLLDWKGIGDGEREIPYSVETAYEFLMENVELRNFVVSVASDDANFVAEKTAADSKY